MLDRIIDHWSCDWCGTEASIERQGIPPGTRPEDMHKFPTRADWQLPTGWRTFGPGSPPWHLRMKRPCSVLGSMCWTCLGRPVPFEGQTLVWDHKAECYRPLAQASG